MANMVNIFPVHPVDHARGIVSRCLHRVTSQLKTRPSTSSAVHSTCPSKTHRFHFHSKEVALLRSIVCVVGNSPEVSLLNHTSSTKAPVSGPNSNSKYGRNEFHVQRPAPATPLAREPDRVNPVPIASSTQLLDHPPLSFDVHFHGPYRHRFIPVPLDYSRNQQTSVRF